MKIDSIEIKVKIVASSGKVYEGAFETMADAGKFAEDATYEIYS